MCERVDFQAGERNGAYGRNSLSHRSAEPTETPMFSRVYKKFVQNYGWRLFLGGGAFAGASKSKKPDSIRRDG